MLFALADIKTWKYNNLTNQPGMIWHIDPATETLETNQFWKLAFRIIETLDHENNQFAYLNGPKVV